MSALPWIIASILVLLILFSVLAILSVKSRKGKKRPIDYYSWFVIGIVWIIVGLIWITDTGFFFIMGLVFVILSLVHKKEWKKNREANKWKNLNKTERKIYMFTLILLAVLVVIGVILLLVRKTI